MTITQHLPSELGKRIAHFQLQVKKNREWKEYTRSSWTYNKSWISILAAGSRSREILVYATQQKEFVTFSHRRWSWGQCFAFLSQISYCSNFFKTYQFVLCIPLLAVGASATTAAAAKASALNQKQQRRVSLIPLMFLLHKNAFP